MSQAPTPQRSPLNRGPEIGQSQRETPDNENLPERADYRAMMFDADGYALTHNRNLFAASRWLSELIEAEAQWPVVGNELRDYLAARGHTMDHIDQQIFALERLIAPWLNTVRKVT
ncbi:MAG: hypothetical protein WBF53_16155 [Litorimonas sp.]